MKKYIAILACVAMLSACHKSYSPKNVDLLNVDDSLCYAMGVMTGSQLGQYVEAQNDSVYDGVEEILKGIRGTMESKDEFDKYEQIGEQLGNMLKSQEKEGMFGDSALALNKELFVQALVNALLADSTVKGMDVMQANMYLQELQRTMERARLEKDFGANREEGEAFLAENKQRPGITTTESGLQYEILKVGKGKKPTIDSRVRVHYHGTLIDGTVFDSSVDRGEPAEFGLLGVIQGWTEVLQLMPEGSKWRVYIPQELAYGERPPMGSPIKPFSALIFDIELIKIL